MKIEEYQGIIEKTAVYPREVTSFGLAYCWLGLIGESEEVLNANHKDKKNLKKEIGDVLWYTTAICAEQKLDLKGILSFIEDLEISPSQAQYCPSIYQYSEKIKKHYRDNKEIDKGELEIVLGNNLYELLWACEMTSEDLPEIMEMNYNKLIKRRETGTLHGSGDNREEKS